MDKYKLIQYIKEKIDPDELVDILGLTTENLVDELYDIIVENEDRFDYLEEQPLGEYNYEED